MRIMCQAGMNGANQNTRSRPFGTKMLRNLRLVSVHRCCRRARSWRSAI